MTKIKNTVAYTIKRPLALTDYAVGTNSENSGVGMAKGQTISMQLTDIRNVVLSGISPDIGGTLKIAEIEYTGVLTSPATVANALDPDYVVSPYEVLIFNVNGKKYLLKLQDVTIGDNSPNISDSDFITIISIKSTGLDVSFDLEDTVIESKAGVNVGDAGVNVYKGLNSTSKLHEFRKAKSVGFDVTIDGDSVKYETKAGSNLGGGIEVYKGVNATTKIHEFNTLNSSDIKIKLNSSTGVIDFSLPQSSSVPSIYINQDYIPSYDDWLKGKGLDGNFKGEGSLAKPFTDTCTYTLGDPLSYTVVTPNSAVQNGFDFYKGPTGTRLLPDKRGQKIQILSSEGDYNYAGDFNYSFLNLEIYGVVSSSISTALLDLDDSSYFDSGTGQNVVATINMIGTESQLTIFGDGFFNSGNNIPTNTYAYKKTIELLGEGRIFSVTNDIDKYIINAGVANSNNNAGHLTFDVKVNITCTKQGIILNSNKSRVQFNNAEITSGSVVDTPNANLEAIKVTGGNVLFLGGNITLFDGAGVLTRLRGIVFDSPVFASGSGASINMRNVTLGGGAITWFDRKDKAGTIDMLGCTSLYFVGTNLFGSSGNAKIWGKQDRSTEGYVTFIGNVLENIGINFNIIDFTSNGERSVSNTIGSDVVLSLKTFDSVRGAKLSSVPLGGAFLKRVILNDESQFNDYRIGDEFKIISQSASPFDFGPYSLQGGAITAVGAHFQKNSATSPNWGAGVEIAYDQISVVS
jgi:hypothetical protein